MSDKPEQSKDNGQGDETIESGGPQPVYGVSIFMLENGQTIAHVTGTPTIEQIYTMVAERQNAVFANMVANAVVNMLRAEEEARRKQAQKQSIVIPRLELKGGKPA